MSLKVELMRVDGDKNELIELKAGKHVIGRGPVLKCNDKRVSRNHAVLDISDDGIYIKPIHVSPCFHKTSESDEFTTLKKDELKSLRNGDRISLLPWSWVYKIIINEDKNLEPEENDGEVNEIACTNTVNRTLPSWLIKLAEKDPTENSDSDCNKLKNPKREKVEGKPQTTKRKVSTDEDDEDEIPKKQAKPKKESKNAKENKKRADRVNENDSNELETHENSNKTKLKTSPSRNTQASTSEVISASDSEEESKTSTKETTKLQTFTPASTSQNSSRIQSDEQDSQNSSQKNGTDKSKKTCPYGSKCYRKNPEHLKEFSHNDDASDEDDKPECEYGLDCYRKNPQHLRDYKHTKRVRNAAKKARAKAREVDEDDDETGSNLSFVVDDDDESEYAVSGSESDEYEDLMDEADDFVKRQK